jgi:MYXO-CTERM domain-containing protein
MKRLTSLLALAVLGLAAFSAGQANAQTLASFTPKAFNKPFVFTSTNVPPQTLSASLSNVPVTFSFGTTALQGSKLALANTTVDAKMSFSVTATAAATLNGTQVRQQTNSGTWKFVYDGPSNSLLNTGDTLLEVTFGSALVQGEAMVGNILATDPSNGVVFLNNSAAFNFAGTFDQGFSTSLFGSSPAFSIGTGGVMSGFRADGVGGFSLSVVPEPASLAMAGLGLLGLTGIAVVRRRRVAN